MDELNYALLKTAETPKFTEEQGGLPSIKNNLYNILKEARGQQNSKASAAQRANQPPSEPIQVIGKNHHKLPHMSKRDEDQRAKEIAVKDKEKDKEKRIWLHNKQK